ncbi:MAG TPA: amino acid permease, partial [Candidatus Limnocylindria bacterium]|nr:amino acid permease [Candidatus Limnocylindria bacterium]
PVVHAHFNSPRACRSKCDERRWRSSFILKSVAELKRQIGLRTAAALVVGEVIAVGIFLTPAGMAKQLGSPLWLLIVWLVMGAMALAGALCYGELAARYPEAGGGYVYLREAYGPAVAFMYGWMAFLVMDPGLTAALAVGLATYAGYMVNIGPLGTKLLAIGTIVVVALINIRGVRLGAWFVRAMMFLKLGLLAFVILWALVFQLGDWANFAPFVARHPNSPPLIAALAGGLIGAFFSFAGWWDLGKLAGEVKDPARTLPKALTMGVVVVTIVYIVTSLVFVYLVPLEQVTTGETFAAQAGEVLFGRAGGLVFSAIVVVAVLGSLAAVVMSAPRVYFAMARDGLFIPAVAAIHPRFETPALATALQASLASILVGIVTFSDIISYFVFVVIVFVALTVLALFKFRRRSEDVGFLTPGYPVTPIIFLVLVMVLLFLLGAGNPKQAALGVAVVSLGWPVYQFLFRRKSTEETRTSYDVD